jgi:hypothetical protein
LDPACSPTAVAGIVAGRSNPGFVEALDREFIIILKRLECTL